MIALLAMAAAVALVLLIGRIVIGFEPKQDRAGGAGRALVWETRVVSINEWSPPTSAASPNSVSFVPTLVVALPAAWIFGLVNF